MPTESRKRSRSPISRTTRRAIARSVSVSSSASIHSSARARRELRVLVDVEPADGDREALRPQAGAVAARARLQRHQRLDPLARVLGLGVLVAALEAVQHALEAHRVVAPAPEAVAVGDRVAVVAGALEQQLAVGSGRSRQATLMSMPFASATASSSRRW